MTAGQVLALTLAYLIGAIPIGLLAGFAKGVDVRQIGSGNIGTTNVIRAVGTRIGIAVFAGDVLKGVLGVLLCKVLGGEGWMLGMAALLVVMGHCFSPYLGFKGGKGVATSLGAFLALRPLLGLACLAIWVVVVATTRYVSLGSVLAVAAGPVILYATSPAVGAEVVVAVVVIALLVIGRHNDNIERLLKGTENRVGTKQADRGSDS